MLNKLLIPVKIKHQKFHYQLDSVILLSISMLISYKILYGIDSIIFKHYEEKLKNSGIEIENMCNINFKTIDEFLRNTIEII